MRRFVTGICAVGALVVVERPAGAVGCFSGALAGAIAGHMAGHGVLGAAGGCMAGHAYHKHQLNRQAYQNRDDYLRQRQQADPDFQNPWHNR